MTSHEPNAQRSARKDEHVTLATSQRSEREAHHVASPFDELSFLHHALGGVSVDQVDSSVRFARSTWALPFYVNGMTGGTEWTHQINRELAIAARETGLAIATGSVSVALDAPEFAPSFQVMRQENPDGFVMANIGVDRSPDDARRAVDLLQANALQVHVNAVQELAMPEGSREFDRWPASLEAIVAASPVPVIVKEVGFGLSRETLIRLRDLGVAYADVSGRGGTDFLSIENARRTTHDYSMLKGFGQSALECLLDAPATSPTLLASGGVRNPLDVVKALACGARAVGVAGTFLQAVLDGGAEQLVSLTGVWASQTTSLMALLGARSVDALQHTDVRTTGKLAEFLEQRGVNRGALSNRSSRLTS